MSRPILPVDPAAALMVRRVQATSTPTTAQLFTRALTGTDFLGDVTLNADLPLLAANATDAAIEQLDIDVPAIVINTVRRMLVAHANDRLMDAADAANDAFRDARDAGDVDGDGEPVPPNTYRSAV